MVRQPGRAGGDEQARQCGWLEDRFGVSWQVVPRVLPELAVDPVVHFEMPCDNRERIARIYEAAFGWKMQMLGGDMEIPGVGQYASFFDTEGNRVSMLQPSGMRGAP